MEFTKQNNITIGRYIGGKTYKLKIKHVLPTHDNPWHEFYMIYYLEGQTLKEAWTFIYYKVNLNERIRNHNIPNEVIWLNNFINNIKQNKIATNFDLKSIDDLKLSEYKTISLDNSDTYNITIDQNNITDVKNIILEDKNNILKNNHGSLITYNNYEWSHHFKDIQFIIPLNEESKKQFIYELEILRQKMIEVLTPCIKEIHECNIRNYINHH